MSKLVPVLLLCIILVFGVSMGKAVYASPDASSYHGSKQVTANQAVIRHPHKISWKQAINIALNAHKNAKILAVKLQENIYIIHLKTVFGKRTVKVGANTGRILYDKLDSVSKL